MKIKRVLPFILFLFLFSPNANCEIIRLKNGKTIEGKIIQKTADYVKIEFYGVPLTYFLEDIQSIEEEPRAKIDDAQRNPSLPAYSTLSNLASSKEPTEIFKNASPAIVYITTQAATGESYLGSGFIVHASGIVVTNYHVVSSARKINVKLKDGSIYPVTSIIYYDPDPNHDICILKIDCLSLPVVPLGDAKTLQVGEKIYCIGNPLGLEYSFSDGILSGIRDSEGVKWLQFTAPVAPGNSGGPIINSRGEVMGMVTFLIRSAQNLNFALAIDEIKPYISTVPKLTMEEFVKNTGQAGNAFLEGMNLSQEGLSGVYAITYGLNPSNKTTYTGNVYIAQGGETYKLLWEFFGSVPYAGVGIVVDNTLCVGWSSGDGFGVVVYKVEEGKLKGRWTSSALGGLIGFEDLEGPVGLNGVYKIVNSLNPQTNMGYSGTVSINPEGDVYSLNWTLASEAYSGVGILCNDLLIVGWGVGQSVGVFGYQIDDEKLFGRWAIPAITEIGVENLSKVASQDVK